jgi:hypothetical protein
LKGQHPDLLRTMEKMSLFDGTMDGSDLGSEDSPPSTFCNLDDALNSESESKPVTQREDQREEKSECTATGTAASPTKKETVTSAGQILKNKGDPPQFQMMLPFPNSQAAISLMRKSKTFRNLLWRNVLQLTSRMRIVANYFC